MKRMAVLIAALTLVSTTVVQGQHTPTGRKSKPMQTNNDITMVAPGLEKYAQGPLAERWKRPGITPRDRSIVTISALIARNQTIEMPYYFNLALDHGVKPRELSEIITHLAFYSGWENAMSAVAVAKVVFADRKIGTDQLRLGLHKRRSCGLDCCCHRNFCLLPGVSPNGALQQCRFVGFAQSFALSIHSRTLAGQLSSFVPSASQLLRNFTTSRSSSLTSR
jgi:alkylhydroperoxidase/carboxymuconolactone decarboxylase family protein YurZ